MRRAIVDVIKCIFNMGMLLPLIIYCRYLLKVSVSSANIVVICWLLACSLPPNMPFNLEHSVTKVSYYAAPQPRLDPPFHQTYFTAPPQNEF